MGKVCDSGEPPRYAPHRPSPADQVRFLANIERILSEGSFVATYKYALLVALVELAIERGDETDAPLPLPLHDIAEKFAELYWRQAAPYDAGGASSIGFVLHQNTGKQAAAISRLTDLRRGLPGARTTLAEARRSQEWRKLVTRMKTVVRSQPLKRLQLVGHNYVPFLYTISQDETTVTLLPGVACHLRERAPLIRRLVEAEWLKFVLELPENSRTLGKAVRLSEFLFGSNRAALALKLSKPLLELQDGRCFYCQRGIAKAGAVDHFIPWSRYPRDLAHNLVLAHAGCNSHKSDRLGGERFLERWVEFVDTHDDDLRQVGNDAGLLVDRSTSLAVAEWSYGHAERVHAEVWLGGKEYGHLSAGWRGLLEAAGAR